MKKYFRFFVFAITCVTGYVQANDFSGTWKLDSGEYINDEGETLSYKSLKLKSIKVISDTHYSFVTMAGDKFWSSGAGKYRVTKNQYIESAVHTSYGARKGKEYAYNFKMENGFLYCSLWEKGVRVEYEVWRKIQ